MSVKYKDSSKRMISKISKWIVLLLLAGTFLVAGKREARKEESSLLSFFLKQGKDWIQESMLYSQSVITGLLGETQPVLSYSYEQTDIRTESRLPFTQAEISISPEEGMWDHVWEENQIAQNPSVENEVFDPLGPFLPAEEKQIQLKWEKYQSLEELIKGFYTVDSTTSVEESLLNIGDLKNTDSTIEKGGDQPQILLYHTHSQESFADSVAGVEKDTIVGAGEVLASLLEEYGYVVLHHKGQYDVEKRDYAYSEALPDIEGILKENPSIQVVIDLHRDAVREEVKLVTDIQGKETAQVMFFNGLSRSREQGEISYLKNPYLKENLAFSFKMKAACDEYYPGFARNIYLRAYRYNMHVCPKTLLIELGAQTNTIEEIHNALYPLAHVLDMVLSGEA